tara:strand:- start:532 stop:1074 length:543 start_codon:yes stop_codon:yes gene_type:complete
MTTSTTPPLDELDSLRDIIKKSHEEELAKAKKTKILEENPQINARHRKEKTNPKFCYLWNHLDLDLKINRIIEFTSRFIHEKDLPSSTGKKIRKLLVSSLVNGLLDVEYDPVNGKILNVPKLFFNPKDGYFLGTYLDNDGNLATRISKISDINESSGDGGISITTEDFTSQKKTISLKKK